jgi:hypothetical protein
MPRIHIYIHTRDSSGFEEAKHPRAKNGEFGKGGTAAKGVKKPARAGIQWQPEDTHNKTGNLERSGFSSLPWAEGTGKLQQIVKNATPKWIKGQPMSERRAALETYSKSIPVQRVNASELFATQWNVQTEGVREYKDPLFSTIGGQHPVAVSLPDGSLHVLDGHHRVDAAAAKGEKIDVKVIPYATT